ncbi:MAG: LuxR family transcriptional regulator [Cytophagales bacterium]|nr:MAG: LuxR family transcriptional regulator [Cytophagales bacterium]
MQANNSMPTTWTTLTTLTDRERTVTLLIGKGYEDKEIAHFLHTQPSTVYTQKKTGFAKLGLKTRRDLFQFVAHYPHLFLTDNEGEKPD